MPCDNGYYYTLALIERFLGRNAKTWPQRALNKDIHFPHFFVPTSGYNGWLSIDIRAVNKEKNDHKKSKKRKSIE